jgi:predicted MPP superfamily phosphohydrolase
MFLLKIKVMRGFRLAIFLTVFFLLYGSINLYIYFGAINALEIFAPPIWVSIFIGFFYFVVFSYPVARITGKWLPPRFTDFLAFVGGMWFAAMLYLIMALVVIDLGSLIVSFVPILENLISPNISLVNAILFFSVASTVLILLIYGYVNAIHPEIKKLELDIEKKPGNLKSLHIVFASDIHLGHVIGAKTLDKIIGKINSLQPDVILFPGDLVDEELKPVIDKHLGQKFKTLRSKYGVFAVTGNHEYIGGVDQAVNYLSQFGIRFLRDEMLKIAESFYVGGREDISISAFTGRKRKSVRELLDGYNPELPFILMDHQPIALSEAAEAGIDLQVSGHTHHGQMWPMQAITNRIFKLSWGYLKINGSHFYVSSGAGSWGPRVRIGNAPEIVSIKLKFTA